MKLKAIIHRAEKGGRVRLLSCAILVSWCILHGGFGVAQELRVRVVDTQTGRSLIGKKVDVEPVQENPTVDKGSAQIRQLHPHLALKTGRDGWASFRLNQLGSTLPKRLVISVAVGNWTQCSPLYVPVDEAIQSGVVAKNLCRTDAAANQQYAAAPGEIVVFAKRIGLREKLKQFPG